MYSGHDKVKKDKLGLLGFGDSQSVKPVVSLEYGKSFLHEVM
jgi:hypothetical protein